MWISFETAVFELVDVYVPIKQDRRKKKGKWLSRATRKKMKKRDEAWKKYRRCQSGRNFEAYRRLRIETNNKQYDKE
jgi:hypothetical protein